jgi:hypothetical protein
MAIGTEDRIRALASNMALSLNPRAYDDVVAYIDAGEWALALSDLRDIAILEDAQGLRCEAEAIARSLGVDLHPPAAAMR